jgi:hypothetical protein
MQRAGGAGEGGGRGQLKIQKVKFKIEKGTHNHGWTRMNTDGTDFTEGIRIKREESEAGL